jgi:hypothetical protein
MNNFFLFLWVVFAFLDSDPESDCESGPDAETPLNPDQIWIHHTGTGVGTGTAINHYGSSDLPSFVFPH